jgi:hypothetical protein
MTGAVRGAGWFTHAIQPLLRTLATRAVRRRGRKLEVVSRRMGLLQMGGSHVLFQSVPGLADMVDAGFGAKRSLATIQDVLSSGSNVHWDNVAVTLGAIDEYVKDAHATMDALDKGRPRKDRLFVVRKNVKGMF